MTQSYFVGRRPIIEQSANCVLSGVSALIIGLPLSGKTDLLGRLPESFEIEDNVICISYDCKEFSTGVSWNDVLDAIVFQLQTLVRLDSDQSETVKRLIKGRQGRYSSLSEAETLETDTNMLTTTVHLIWDELSTLFSELKRVAPSLRFVFLLDNLDAWANNGGSLDFRSDSIPYSIFERMAMDELDNVSVVATVADPWLVVGFPKKIYLQPLSAEQVSSLVVQYRSSKPMPPSKLGSMVKDIMAFTGGFPGLVMTLLRQIDLSATRLEERAINAWKEQAYTRWSEKLKENNYFVPTDSLSVDRLLDSVATKKPINPDDEHADQVLSTLVKYGLLEWKRRTSTYLITVRPLQEELLGYSVSKWNRFFASYFPYSGDRLIKWTLSSMFLSTILMIVCAALGVNPFLGLMAFLPVIFYAVVSFLGLKV